MTYKIRFHPKWDGHYSKLDKSLRQRVMKKIMQLQGELPARHLGQGLPFYVCEIGQYRLCYETDEGKKVRTMFFVGTHKEYEKWTGI